MHVESEEANSSLGMAVSSEGPAACVSRKWSWGHWWPLGDASKGSAGLDLYSGYAGMF